MNGLLIIMITAMARCLHIFDSGFQCIGEAVDPTDFCEAHQKVVAFESDWLQDSIWRKTLLRVVALVLLLMFLIPLFYTLRDLYLGPPVKAQEVW
jgi:hypothetical protein